MVRQPVNFLLFVIVVTLVGPCELCDLFIYAYSSLTTLHLRFYQRELTVSEVTLWKWIRPDILHKRISMEDSEGLRWG